MKIEKREPFSLKALFRAVDKYTQPVAGIERRFSAHGMSLAEIQSIGERLERGKKKRRKGRRKG